MTPKWPKHDPKMAKKWPKNDPKMTQKWPKIDERYLIINVNYIIMLIPCNKVNFFNLSSTNEYESIFHILNIWTTNKLCLHHKITQLFQISVGSFILRFWWNVNILCCVKSHSKDQPWKNIKNLMFNILLSLNSTILYTNFNKCWKLIKFYVHFKIKTFEDI
jgi:hypothetical protein